MKRILVLGSINMDHVTRVEKTPEVGQTVLGLGLDLIPGGKGANQAVAMARLGADVALIGCVGSDGEGETLLAGLEKENVDLEGVQRKGVSATGQAWIMVNADGDNSIVVIPGANHAMSPESLKMDWFSKRDLFAAQLEMPLPLVHRALEMARERGLTTVLNPAPAAILPQAMLSLVDLLIPNETEFAVLTGIAPVDEKALEKGCQKLLDEGVGKVLVTRGAKGAWYMEKGRILQQTAVETPVVDTTAAGDSYIGALLATLSQGESMETAMTRAGLCAAFTVGKPGAQPSLPDRDDLERFLRQQQKNTNRG